MEYKETPIVSISCITYNHAHYIKQCLDGFLMQKTTFPFEVLIHDDASTDGTEEIIREYEALYPNIIKPLYEKENQWVKGRRGSSVFNFPRAKGKYIALCEGDDYWTDPLKLQKQVDFLKENEDCSLCFHASKSIRNNDPNDYTVRRPKNIPISNKFQIEDAILGGGGFMATNSMVFYSKFMEEEKPSWMTKAPVGDLPLMLYLSSKGKIGYIDDVMSVYRIMSSSNSWSHSMIDFSKRKKHHYEILEMWTEFDQWTGGRYHRTILRKKNNNRISYLKGRLKQIIKK